MDGFVLLQGKKLVFNSKPPYTTPLPLPSFPIDHSNMAKAILYKGAGVIPVIV